MAVSAPSLLQLAAAQAGRDAGLVLSPGQVVEAVVAAITAEGIATLQVGDRQLAAQLPTPAPVGTALRLQVTVGGSSPQLTLLKPAVASVTVPIQPAPTSQLPETVVAAVLTARTTLPQGVPPPAAGGPLPRVVVSTAQPSPPSQVPAPASPPASSAPPPASTSAPGPALESTSPASAPAIRPAAVAPGSAGPSPTAVPAPVAETSPTPSQPPATAQAPVSAAPTQSTGQPISQAAMTPLPARPAQQVPSAPLVPTSGPAPLAQSQLVQTLPAPNTPPAAPPVSPQVLSVQPAAMPVMNADPDVASVLIAQQAPAPSAGPPAPSNASAVLARAAGFAQPAAGATKPVASPGPVAPAVASATPATPAAAVAREVPQALARQDSLGPLLQTLAVVAAGPIRLPGPILQLVRQILAQRVVVDGAAPNAEALQHAVERSGTWLEARLAAGQPVARDLKAMLFNLRAALGAQAELRAATPPGGADRAPPPLKDLLPRVPDGPSAPAPGDATAALKQAATQTDAALSRIKLAQIASLPDADAAGAPTAFRVEIPLLAGTELVMAQMRIAPDAQHKRREQKRGWTVQFAMNLAQAGEVGAEVGILDRTIDVGLWALDPDLATRMREMLPELGQAIVDSGLRPGRLRVRSGPPDAPRPAEGRLVDSTS